MKKLDVRSAVASAKDRVRDSAAADDGAPKTAETGQGSVGVLPSNLAMAASAGTTELIDRSGGTHQKKDVALPVSGATITCTHQLLDPDACVVSSMNPRSGELLSESDPFIVEIREQFEHSGQRDPVLARRVDVDGKAAHEIIYGRTRLFVAKLLGIQLRAWVGDIPDKDVRRLAREENRGRRGLSAWERANDLERAKAAEYAGMTVAEMCTEEGVSETYYFKLKKLLSIPLEIVALLESPQSLTAKNGPPLAKWCETGAAKDRQKALRVANKEAPFEDAGTLLRLLRSVGEIAEQPADEGGRSETLYTQDKSHRWTLNPSRTKAGSYVVKMDGFSGKELDRLMRIVKKEFGLN